MPVSLHWSVRALLLALVLAGARTAESGELRQVLQQGTVMGFRHHEGKRLWSELKIGDRLSLTRERDNAYDEKAIRVDWRGHKLGYVPRADNVDLARLMDNGLAVEARITRLEKSRRPNNRVAFEAYVARIRM